MTIYAFIDSQNLYKSVDDFGYSIDYRKFRLWLTNHYGINEAYMYFGYMESYRGLYRHLRSCGFELVFRDVEHYYGRYKSNVDICLTISVLDKLEEFQKAYLISSDGDFFDLVKRLKERDKFGGVISPQENKKCSTLLKRAAEGKIDFIPEVFQKFRKPRKKPFRKKNDRRNGLT